MKYFFIIICLSVIVFSFTKKDCDHIYVDVAAHGYLKDTIEQDRTLPVFTYAVAKPERKGVWYEGGQEYVCIKCHNLKKQTIKVTNNTPDNFWLGAPSMFLTDSITSGYAN